MSESLHPSRNNATCTLPSESPPPVLDVGFIPAIAHLHVLLLLTFQIKIIEAFHLTVDLSADPSKWRRFRRVCAISSEKICLRRDAFRGYYKIITKFCLQFCRHICQFTPIRSPSVGFPFNFLRKPSFQFDCLFRERCYICFKLLVFLGQCTNAVLKFRLVRRGDGDIIAGMIIVSVTIAATAAAAEKQVVAVVVDPCSSNYGDDGER